MRINWFNSERKITDSISENLTDSDLESIVILPVNRNLKSDFRVINVFPDLRGCAEVGSLSDLELSSAFSYYTMIT